MRKLNTLLLSFLFILILLSTACKKDRNGEDGNPETNNEGVTLNSEIMRLGSFFGNVFSDVVLITAQSGPDVSLQTSALKELLELTERDNEFFVFNTHQVQTLNPQKFNTEITFEMAQSLNQESVDILAQVIRYFKNQDKKVYVLGIAYGAYLTQELILQEGPNIADKFLLMSGRLDMPDLIWKSFSEGNTGGFNNGTTPFIGMPSTLSDTEKNMNKLLGGLSFKRYTSELSMYNDLSNVTYSFGTFDETMGQLTQNEQALLITRLANVLELTAGHQEAIEGLLDEGFEVAF